MSIVNLNTPLVYLKGVGPHKAELLKKELNLLTYADLIGYYPFRYLDRTKFFKVSTLSGEMPIVQILVRIIKREQLGEGRTKRLVYTARDETGYLELVWFKSLAWIERQIELNSVYVVFGKPVDFNNKISLVHPEIERYEHAKKSIGSAFLQPVYSTTEKLKRSGLDSKGIGKLQTTVLEEGLPGLEETLPVYILDRFRLCNKAEAMKMIHFPRSQAELDQAQRRLKFEELFFIQLKLLRNKQLRSQKFKGIIFSSVGEKFNEFYSQRLPFELTNAQKRVIKEIRSATNTGVQMNRLLQGDVGSGKTVVALLSMLIAIDNGYQCCLMAPTEILARQHFESLKNLLGESSVTVNLLTGSTSRKARTSLSTQLINGDLDILVGTHALIEDSVQFQNLGFVVIDEQHRFGVEQRSKLWKKSKTPPHVLVMTATPIPRTLAMTLYGDLDVSVIDELPAGRKEIKTLHLFENQRLRMFGFMRQEIAKGRQVYIVYPLIKESEKLDLLNLETGIETISKEFPLPDFRISIVHGKLTPKEKEFEMQRFVKGETQIMVATTVIEVGVNVPNASVMVIENAERFGLSQLHQLRGRVGRGAEQSFCILMSGQKLSADSKTRLTTMVETTDGFKIAEIDLKLRGPGAIEGTQQSGVLDLKIADIAKDQNILLEARNFVIQLFEKDPQLELPENQILLKAFQSKADGITWDKIS